MFTAYKRDLNAGFATELVLVQDNVIVDQNVSTFNAAATAEGIPDLVGGDVSALRGKGFRRITSQSEMDKLIERYESRPPDYN